MPQEQMPERELLAEYAHEAWSGWMKYLFSKCDDLGNGSKAIPYLSVDRWMRQMNTPYAELSENEKDSDRAEADKMLALLPASNSTALQEELEQARVQLAGCGVAAMQNTPNSIKDRAKPGDYGYSASYGDVCRAVDREIALRERVELAEALLKEAQTLLNDAVKNGCLILGRCELDSRLSSFLHDGTKGEGK